MWRPRGERLNPDFTKQRHIVPAAPPCVATHGGAPGAIFQQNNARLQTSRMSQDYLRHIITLPWSTQSPDLTPIEHMWDHLWCLIGQPTGLVKLETHLQQLCNEMS
ncbi:transposable element Tcb2 transposase [Trichonephila clavipes]|uniref:Transposable element Tcb2 transposase n=1 Tax=Trichonephila clavipes TaxID=2585209 RepID=A0A8X6UZ43_TRICX|nr:transposable element Tcb2 transposase [Trichonephila clavipes]